MDLSSITSTNTLIGFGIFLAGWAGKRLLDWLWTKTKPISANFFSRVLRSLHRLREHEANLKEKTATDAALRSLLVGAATYQLVRASIFALFGMSVWRQALDLHTMNFPPFLWVPAYFIAGYFLGWSGLSFANARFYYVTGSKGMLRP